MSQVRRFPCTQYGGGKALCGSRVSPSVEGLHDMASEESEQKASAFGAGSRVPDTDSDPMAF